MPQPFHIIISVLIVVGILATYFYRVRKRINLESWFKEQGLIKIKVKELDPQLRPLLKIRFPKLLVEGVYTDRVCVFAFTEASGSDGDSTVTVSTQAVQSAIQWPRISIQPIRTFNRLSRNRVKSGNKVIDKHWIITSTDEPLAKCVIQAMHEELLDIPKVAKSFRLSSGQDTDTHTRCELEGHWIVMAKQATGYNVDEAKELLAGLPKWARKFEQAASAIK